MLHVPRHSLATQTAGVLREAILSGQWSRWLPGELELTRRLGVSRATLRAALGELEKENLIRGGQGRRREVVPQKTAPRRRATPSKSVVLLSPEPLHRLPTATVYWIDELREHLEAAGRPLEVREGGAVYRCRPARALEELATRLQPSGWVLFRSTLETQRWFSSHAQSVVIAGSPHPGISLCSVDVDHAAACRHAAGRFLANGHRRLAIVHPDTNLAGDLDSISGFEAGAGEPVPVARHDGTMIGICRALDRLFARKPAPTGLLVFHAPHVLTVLGWLHRRQREVPTEVSVICRDSDPLLEFVLPSPTRYELKTRLYARTISRLVADLVANPRLPPKQLRIIPDFVRGETLGAAQGNV